MAIQPTLFETEPPPRLSPARAESRRPRPAIDTGSGTRRGDARDASSLLQVQGAVQGHDVEGDVRGESLDGREQDGQSPAVEEGLDQQAIIRRLRAQVGCVTTAPPPEVEQFSTGAEGLDRFLPRGGLCVEGITEWVAEAEGCGAAAFSMIATSRRLNSVNGPLLVVGGEGVFYPPAAVALGIPAHRVIWVRPTRHADVVWAIDQGLRCEPVAAVWAHVGPNLDDRDARRFQLAAEAGRTPGLFVRPPSVRGRPSFADVRFHVGVGQSVVGLGRSSVITLDRCRGGTIGRSLEVRIDDRVQIHEVTPKPSERRVSTAPYPIESNNHETAAVRLASELAHPTSSKSTGRRRA